MTTYRQSFRHPDDLGKIVIYRSSRTELPAYDGPVTDEEKRAWLAENPGATIE